MHRQDRLFRYLKCRDLISDFRLIKNPMKLKTQKSLKDAGI
jgi:hypothetical protein